MCESRGMRVISRTSFRARPNLDSREFEHDNADIGGHTAGSASAGCGPLPPSVAPGAGLA